ncbi:MAG: division/cell wall cluster transcriptional repressor MraZ [Bacteroidota bacterium]
MISLMGEYECRIDAKGRVMMPVALKKQLPSDKSGAFVMNRGFEKCLVMYPKDEWNIISDELNKLNLYSKKNRDFFRYFMRGASQLELDTNGRFLIPRSLLDYAGVEQDIVLFAYSNRIEVWNKNTYENLLTNEPDDFANLAEEVMVHKNIGDTSTEHLS